MLSRRPDKEAEGVSTLQRGPCAHRAEVGVTWPQAQERLDPQGEKRQEGASPHASEGLQLLTLNHWLPEPGEAQYLLFQATPCVVICDSGHRKLIQRLTPAPRMLITP